MRDLDRRRDPRRGADAVVRVEDTRRDGDDVELAVAVPVGASVRYAGEDVRAGEALLEPGLRLGPAELGILAALGSAGADRVPAAACRRRHDR